MAKHAWGMPGCPDTQTGEWTPGWYVWDKYGRPALFKCQHDGTWVHMLVADVGERIPDDNHIHMKFRKGDSWDDVVLAAVKIDRIRIINRGELLNWINRLIVTHFTVDDIQGE